LMPLTISSPSENDVEPALFAFISLILSNDRIDGSRGPAL